jgi:hypothetical protein
MTRPMGPLGNKAGLTKSRDMPITSRDRVHKLKSAGKSALEAVAEKTIRRSRPRLGQRDSDQWVQIVYLSSESPAEYFPDEQSVK